MENMIHEILINLGIPSGTATLIFFIVKEMISKRDKATEARKEQRDAEMMMLGKDIESVKQSLTRHISHHKDYESSICRKIDKVYEKIDKQSERLNPIADAISKIQGYMEAKNDKGS